MNHRIQPPSPKSITAYERGEEKQRKLELLNDKYNLDYYSSSESGSRVRIGVRDIGLKYNCLNSRLK